MNSLTNTVSADKLHTIISVIKKNNARFTTDKKINSYPALSNLYNGDDKQREKSALQLLGNWSKDKEAAVESLKHMIEINDAKPYVVLWKLHHPVLRRYANHLGYAISTENNTPMFVKTSNDESIKVPDTEVLVNSLINTFVRNDINLFKSSLLDKNILELMDTGIKKPSYKNKTEERYKKLSDNSINSWKKVYNKAKENGFEWNNINIISSVNNILVNINGVHIATIDLILEANEKQYSMVLENCILFDGQWYSLTGIKWK